MFQPLIVPTEGVFSYIKIEDVHQFIGHCLIPLDPCIKLKLEPNMDIKFLISIHNL